MCDRLHVKCKKKHSFPAIQHHHIETVAKWGGRGMRSGFSKRKVVRPIVLEVLPMRGPGSRVGSLCADLSSSAPPTAQASSMVTCSSQWQVEDLVGRILPTDQGGTEQIK